MDVYRREGAVVPLAAVRRRRWSGLAALLGGILGIALTPILTFAGMMAGPGGGPPPMPWTRALQPVMLPLVTFGAREDVLRLWGSFGLPIYLLFLIGLLGLNDRVRRRLGRAGRLGFQVATVGLVMNMVGNEITCEAGSTRAARRHSSCSSAHPSAGRIVYHALA